MIIITVRPVTSPVTRIESKMETTPVIWYYFSLPYQEIHLLKEDMKNDGQRFEEYSKNTFSRSFISLNPYPFQLIRSYKRIIRRNISGITDGASWLSLALKSSLRSGINKNKWISIGSKDENIWITKTNTSIYWSEIIIFKSNHHFWFGYFPWLSKYKNHPRT